MTPKQKVILGNVLIPVTIIGYYFFGRPVPPWLLVLDGIFLLLLWNGILYFKHRKKNSN
jgi:hypothetical protein